MHKRRHKVRLVAGVLASVTAIAITLMFTFTSCTGPVSPGISREEAIELAVQRVEEEGVMSLEGRDTEVEEQADHWHIYFPYTSHEVYGGEPHVLVDKASGEVTDSYYTQ